MKQVTMESSLVQRGKDYATELKANFGAVNLHDVATLIGDLVSQLEAKIGQLSTMTEQRDALVVEMSIVKNDYATIPEVKCIGWPNTPNFDAAIAALRAEAIRFAACHLPDNGKYQDIIYVLANEIEEGLTEFKFPVASQLRDSKGANHE